MATIAAVVLCAGASQRHASGPKLLRESGGAPLIRRTLDMVTQSGVEQRLVVVRAGDADISAHARALGFAVIENPAADRGIGSSIACGVSAIGDADAVAIFLGDMPLIRPQTVRSLISLFKRGAAPVVRPAYDGAPGHPVIIARSYFDALRKLGGDEGAARLFRKTDIALVATDDEGVVADFDSEVDFTG